MYTSLMRKYTDSSHKINQVHKGDLQSLDETGDEDKHVRAIKRDRCPETELREKCSSFFNLRDSRSGDGPKRELKEVSSLWGEEMDARRGEIKQTEMVERNCLGRADRACWYVHRWLQQKSLHMSGLRHSVGQWWFSDNTFLSVSMSNIEVTSWN